MTGSSPLTRGKQRRTRVGVIRPRLIPAHAGKTFAAALPRPLATAHPRSRGENPQPPSSTAASPGSSPLTRGKPVSIHEATQETRLIPAHAGKTGLRARSPRRSRAHPRSRGENVVAAREELLLDGSSPLTRGKRARDRRAEGARGLIPAHAGKTATPPSRPSVAWAHPRSRGENLAIVAALARVSGSSPLTRGKPSHVLHASAAIRLIPAHAGKTASRSIPHAYRRAHPRSRGENETHTLTTAEMPGSSPLTRGKRPARPQWARRARLIPAHAGKTSQAFTLPTAVAAHPRSRGENIDAWQLPERHVGSSPLTRGKRCLPKTTSRRRRLIPAHAGKTARRTRCQTSSPAHPRSRGENTDTSHG